MLEGYTYEPWSILSRPGVITRHALGRTENTSIPRAALFFHGQCVDNGGRLFYSR